jgi:hypothetical protein
MIAMITHPKLAVDEFRDAFGRPQGCGISVSLWPVLQVLGQLSQLHRIEPGLTSGRNSR